MLCGCTSFFRITFVCLFFLAPPALCLVDTKQEHLDHADARFHVVISDMESKRDMRIGYKSAVIRTALEYTVATHGAYQLEFKPGGLTNERAYEEMENDGLINVHFSITTPEREQRLLPIRIPIRMGLLSYRLLLIHNSKVADFEKVKDIEDLKPMRVGLRSQWVTPKVLEVQDFNVLIANSFDGLFKMLNENRFDYFPRGVNEIYGELALRSGELNNVQIEPNLALHLLSPFYIFVSPHYPELAQRIEIGLEKMVKDGTLKRMFFAEYADEIRKAELSKRHIIHIPNPLLPPLTPVDREELWFHPLNTDINESYQPNDSM